ncbi:MAG: SusC/RagA family TonB-linked outer membrane protein [Bacteroidia bacterium]
MKRFLTLFLALSTFVSVQSFAQQREITGQVTDAQSGEPLIGVNVFVKGTTIGTTTNLEGNYTLRVPQDAEILVFRYVGMESQEVPLGTTNIVNIQLRQDIMELDAVVVTALGIPRDQKALGYSTQEIGGDELSRAGETNVVQSMAAKASGVQVIGSGGTPGASSKIIIRGNSTFTGNNQPLFIVDGVPIDNETRSTVAGDYPFNANLTGVNNSNRAIDINPDDIESMTILKGPAAAALYGVRAANGAVIIKTKSGAGVGGVRVTYSTSVEASQVNKLPALHSQYAQGSGGGGFKVDSPANVYFPSYDRPVLDAAGTPYGFYYVDNNGQILDSVVYDVADPGPDNLFFTGDDISLGTANSWGPKISELDYLNTYDNMDNYFETAWSWDNNVAVTAGNENSRIRMSIGHRRQEGVIPNTLFERTSVRFNARSSLSERVTVGASANYIKSGGLRSQNGSNLSGVMLSLTRAPATYDLKGEGEEGYKYPNGQQRQYFFPYDNPYWSTYENPFTDDVNRILGNFDINYRALDWLEFTYRLGTDVYSDQRKQVFAIGSWDPPQPTGQLEQNIQRYRMVYSDLLANMTHNFNEDLSGTLLLGNNLFHEYYQDVYSRGRNMDIPDFNNLSNARNLYADESEEYVRTAAFFFDANLDWRSIIYLGVTGRNEWASTFGQANNNFFYPSANISFVFTELLPDNDVFSFGKLRYAYAQAGINPDPYFTRTYFNKPFLTDGFTSGLSYPYLGFNGFGYSSTLGNEELRPEKVVGNEVGLDLRIWNGRLNMDITYYHQLSSDLLVLRPLAPSTGFSAILDNTGKMRNQGIEITLSGIPIKASKPRGFNWLIELNFATNENEVLELAEGVDEIDIEAAFASIGSFAIVGDPYGAFYGSKWARSEAGELIIDPRTGLPIIAQQRGNLGNPYPDWTAFIRNTIELKGFYLTALLDIREGGDVWCGTCARLNQIGRSEESAEREQTYEVEGVLAELDAAGEIKLQENGDPIATETAAAIPITAYDYFRNVVGDLGATENAVFDGSWIRLREVSLGYRFANKMLTDVPLLRTLDISVSARNIWMKTDYPGVDPETSLTGAGSNVGGFDYFNMPSTRSYLFSLRAGF